MRGRSGNPAVTRRASLALAFILALSLTGARAQDSDAVSAYTDLSAYLLPATPAAGSTGHVSTIVQSGSSNEGLAVLTGAGNRSMQLQEGDGNASSIVLSGTANQGMLAQIGSGNAATLSVMGSGNSAVGLQV